MLAKYKNYILLHITVLIWGFTGVIGRFLKDSTNPIISSTDIVWNRMLIAALSLVAVWLFVRYIQNKKVGREWGVKIYLKASMVGVLIAGHWLTFFEAIHLSNISIALVCMSTATFFTSFIEPFFLKKPFDIRETLMGTLAIFGVGFIFYDVSSEHLYAIGIGVLSAFLASLFSVFNAQMVKEYSALKLSTVEMVSGFLVLTIYYFLFTEGTPTSFVGYEYNFLVAILVLGIICTAWAFLVSVNIMKELSVFTVQLAVNMEPIYAIIMALLFYSDTEQMPPKFYVGASIVIGVIMLNGYIKGRMKKRLIKPTI